MIFALNDIAYDSREIERILTKSCNSHQQKYYLRGVCQVEKKVYFVLLPRQDSEPPEHYVIVDLPDSSDEGMDAMFEQRWEAGFNVLATIHLGDSAYLAVYSHPVEP